MLPPVWREENARQREKIRHEECSQRPDLDRIPILVDYLYPKFYVLMTNFSNVLQAIPRLHTLQTPVRHPNARRLLRQVRELDQSVDAFLRLDDVKEVSKRACLTPPRISSKHLNCCPVFPFPPSYFEYPQAAMLRITSTGMRCYLRAILLPPILSALGHCEIPPDLRNGEEFSTEMCRIFAGLDESPTDPSYEQFIPLSGSMILATTFCPPPLRSWLWWKLVHFEELGHLTFDPMRRSLAVLWDMPEIVSKKRITPDYSATFEIVETIQATLSEINLDKEGARELPEAEDESMDPISKGRGLVGLLS
jgi:hypothetical protein